MRDVELFQAPHLGNILRQRSHELVEADIQDGELLEQRDLVGEARLETVVHEYDLVESLRHVAQASRDASMEPVVGKDDDRDGGVAEVIRDIKGEAVVVDEDSVEWLVKQLSRHLAFELVEPDVKEPEAGQSEDNIREAPGEPVVAQIQLVQQPHPFELPRDGAAEAVGVDVEEREVLQQAELLREVPRDVGVVEVDPGDDGEVAVPQGGGAEDALVAAHVGSNPGTCDVHGVGEDGLLPGLQGNVGVAEAWVGEVEGRVDGDVLATVAVLVAVVEELALADVAGLGVGEGAIVGGQGEGGG